MRRFTQTHGGTVTAARKDLTRGSTFTLRLPLLIDAAPISAPPPQPSVAATRRRILVVDDNVESTESLVLLLQMEGHDARAALDGHSAIATAMAFTRKWYCAISAYRTWMDWRSRDTCVR